jgi:hypothetical protein
LVDCDPPKIEYFRRMIPFSFHGFDKQGRPFYVEKSGRIHPDFLLNFFTDEEMLTAHLWSMEISVKRFVIFDRFFVFLFGKTTCQSK